MFDWQLLLARMLSTIVCMLLCSVMLHSYDLTNGSNIAYPLVRSGCQFKRDEQILM